MSTDLKKRLESHNKGKTRSTKPHRPFNKIFSIKAVSSRIEARKLEKYYKSGIGREVLKQTGYSLDG